MFIASWRPLLSFAPLGAKSPWPQAPVPTGRDPVERNPELIQPE